MDDRGSIIPLLAIVFFVVIAASTVIVAIAGHAVKVANAQWAADAAALAIVSVDPQSRLPGEPGMVAAGSLAAANGAVLIGVSTHQAESPFGDPNSSRPGTTPVSPVVVVEVERQGIRARAAAVRFAAPPP